jgi:hypothetical protein
MEADTKMGPVAAGTAIRTLVVPFGKQTVLLCLKSEGRASEFSYMGGGE